MRRGAKWCGILGFLVALSLLTATSGMAAFIGLLAEADALLQRSNLNMQQARRALVIYEELLVAPGSPRFPLLARLGRVCFIMGTMTPENERLYYYTKGRGYAELLAREEPDGTAGHYWLALNLCGLADVKGYMEARRLLPQIFEQLTLAVAIDETYDQAGAHRVLGRIYYEAPGWPMSVGDPEKSLHHLRAAVRLAPENSTNHLYLAETLLRLHQESLARAELDAVLEATRNTQPQGVEKDRMEARRLLGEYFKDHAAMPDFEGTPQRRARGSRAAQESAPLKPSLPGPF